MVVCTKFIWIQRDVCHAWRLSSLNLRSASRSFSCRMGITIPPIDVKIADFIPMDARAGHRSGWKPKILASYSCANFPKKNNRWKFDTSINVSQEIYPNNLLDWLGLHIMSTWLIYSLLIWFNERIKLCDTSFFL